MSAYKKTAADRLATYAKRIRDLREDSDLSQEQVASILHVAQRTYSHYETGSHDIPTEALYLLCDFYDVSIDYLLRGIGNSSPTENNVSGELTNSTVIQANRDGTVFSNERIVSPEANELLHIYDKLGVRERVKLLNFAFGMEEEGQRQ